MNIELESMAIEMPVVESHPNREAFRGVLTLVDVASDRPPSGARGHRVVLTRSAAERALPSLLGMGLDYAPSLDRHDTRRKVGVITRAEIVGRNIEFGRVSVCERFPGDRARNSSSGAWKSLRECPRSASAGNVIRNCGCEGGGFEKQSMDADTCDFYRRCDFAARQSGVWRNVD